VFDPARTPPALLAPGDRVRFEPAADTAAVSGDGPPIGAPGESPAGPVAEPPAELADEQPAEPAAEAPTVSGDGPPVGAPGESPPGALPAEPPAEPASESPAARRPGAAVIEVLAAGPLTTVQDGGRVGWRSLGVPAAGPADWLSHAVANRLVGNPD